MPDSPDSPMPWGSDFYARLDARDREGWWRDGEDWEEFEARVRDEVAERFNLSTKGKERAGEPSDSISRITSSFPEVHDPTQSSPHAPSASLPTPPSGITCVGSSPASVASAAPDVTSDTSANKSTPRTAPNVTSDTSARKSTPRTTETSTPTRITRTSTPTRITRTSTPTRTTGTSTPTRKTETFLAPPTVQTPSVPPPLPAPPRKSDVLPTISHTFGTAATVPTPDTTLGSVGERPRGDPASPLPLSVTAIPQKNRREFQNLSKIYETFSKTAQLDSVKAPTRGRGRGRGSALSFTSRSTSMLGLGGELFKGLRFVIASDKKVVMKHKQYLEVITKLGGTVVLQPDTAITHVIYDAGRNASAAMLARELGISSLSELPVGTVCVKYDWVAQCKISRRLLDPEPWLSFRPTTLTRTTTLAPQASRMKDITHQFVGNGSGALRQRRENTPSDSETESSVSQRRDPPSSPTEASPARKRIKIGDVATRHSPNLGPGWVEPRVGEEDGLDVMIMGVKDGSLEDEISDGTGSEAEEEDKEARDGNPNPIADRYKCGQKHDGTGKGGPNEWLAKEFDKLHSIYEGDRGKNEFAIRGYQKTAGILRRTTYPITSGSQARKIKGIGENMAQRIDEFLSGAQGRAYYENTEKARTVAVFKDVYGVGRNFANELYLRGARTIDDLRTKDFGLSTGQKIGVELYDDLNSRIPREECRELFEKIRTVALTLEPKLWIEIMGSYRRGQETSGDVDILITRDDSDGKTHASVLRSLIRVLQQTGVITHHLSVPHNWEALEAKWMGVGKLSPEGKHRRIDILCIPYEQWGAALLYFTGNEVFNRSMRLYARKKGYSLNQRGLFRGVMRDRKGVKTTEGEVVASRTEQEIFDVLGIRWREPQHRRP